MNDLLRYLQAKLWWNSRYMWGPSAAEALVLDAVWHSGFTFADLHSLPLEDALA